MELQHEFTVPVPVEQAWSALLDLERVAPCMPGATLESFDGETFTGKVRVRVGPITVTYRGEGKFLDRDEGGRRAVIEAKGKEARGTGTAAAKVTTQLTAEGDHTRVNVSTDLAITGRPAQFGRGVMNDVGAKLIGQFADCLATRLTGAEEEVVPPPAPEAPAARPEPPPSEAGAARGATPVGEPAAPRREPEEVGARMGPAEESEPIDLLGMAGAPVLRRAAPALVVLAIVGLLWWLLRRRRRR